MQAAASKPHAKDTTDWFGSSLNPDAPAVTAVIKDPRNARPAKLSKRATDAAAATSVPPATRESKVHYPIICRPCRPVRRGMTQVLGSTGVRRGFQIRQKLIGLKEHRIIFVYWASLVQVRLHLCTGRCCTM